MWLLYYREAGYKRCSGDTQAERSDRYGVEAGTQTEPCRRRHTLPSGGDDRHASADVTSPQRTVESFQVGTRRSSWVPCAPQRTLLTGGRWLAAVMSSFKFTLPATPLYAPRSPFWCRSPSWCVCRCFVVTWRHGETVYPILVTMLTKYIRSDSILRNSRQIVFFHNNHVIWMLRADPVKSKIPWPTCYIFDGGSPF